ncbi:MAG: UDP-N-acetylmuramoyl-L-alanyl-D-glutamate--2,6-diaminopimelate ligase, partial [Nannocystaceae bacterium]
DTILFVVTTLATLLHGLPPEHPPIYVGCSPTTPFGSLRADSRAITPGDVFIACAGARSDGHQFVNGVAEKGGISIVRAGTITGELPRVEVSDPDALLPTIAANAAGWPAKALRTVGITGTNGKTTVAHMVSAIYTAAGRAHLRLGTTGNWIAGTLEASAFTTPFPVELQGLLARGRDASATDLVMEVSSHALAQGRIAPITFDAVAFTSFSQDHLDFHRDMDDYLRAKLLLASTHLSSGGVAVASVAPSTHGEAFLAAAREVGARTWTFAPAGSRAQADIQLVGEPPVDTRAAVTIQTPAGNIRPRLQLPGRFNLDNAMVAAGMALAHEIPLADIEAGLSGAVVPGRLEPVPATADAPRVYVDYAHTPDAIERALAALRPATAGILWIVAGCGGDRDRGKRPQMAAAALRGADRLVATSDNPRHECPERILDDMLAGSDDDRVTRIVERREAIRYAITTANPTDVVLIAGKGHETIQTIGDEVLPFDDRIEARAVLAPTDS